MVNPKRLVVGVTVGMSADLLLRGQLGWFREQGWDVTLISTPDEQAHRAAAREQVALHGIPMARGISPVGDLKGPGKTRPVSHARQVAMYLTRSLIDISLPAIGRVFGDRDHSTVLYAHKKIRDEIADKKATRDQVNDLTTRVRERARNRG